MTSPPQRLRVLMTTDAVGGVWSYCMTLARSLKDRGVEFILAAMGPAPSPDQERDAASIGNVRLLSREGRLEWMEDPWDDVDSAGRWLVELEEYEHPDVVHLNGYAHGAFPFKARSLIVGHSCCLSWWRAVHHGEAPATFDTYRRRVRLGLDRAAAFVSPSGAMLGEFRDIYGALPPSRVIYNAAPRPREVKSKEPLAVCAGRAWDQAKNVAAVAEAALDLPWPVFLAGATAGPFAGKAPCGGLIKLGRLPARQMDELLARASICIHPARYEPFGLLPLEAALHGCALVLGDIPTLREVWGDAAAYVRPDDVAALSRTIRGLIADEAGRQNLAARAAQRARRYSTEVFAEEYLSLYRELAAATPAHAPGETNACGSPFSTTRS